MRKALATVTVLSLLPTAAVVAAPGGVVWYTNQDEFLAAIVASGKPLVGTEDFEEGNVPPNTGIGMNDPLNACSFNGVFVPGDIVEGIWIQSNTNGTPINDPGTSGPNPRGATGLAALGPGANGGLVFDRAVAPTAADNSGDSIDLISIDSGHTAMWLRIADVFPTAFGPFEVRVYDRFGLLLGQETFPGATAGAPFGVPFGFILADPGDEIGRVNLWGVGAFFDLGFGGEEAIYEFAVYGTVPFCADITCDGEVGVDDVLALLAVWGPSSGGGPPDYDGDGEVGVNDLLILLADWGDCP